jgi:hypothetical protein
MESELSPEQQRAVTAATDAPARVVPEGDGETVVLLPVEDFDWVRGHFSDVPEAPRRIDPRTGRCYALVSLALYERFKALFEEDPLSPAERRALLSRAGKRVGWDDPAWGEDGDGRDRP